MYMLYNAQLTKNKNRIIYTLSFKVLHLQSCRTAEEVWFKRSGVTEFRRYQKHLNLVKGHLQYSTATMFEVDSFKIRTVVNLLQATT